MFSNLIRRSARWLCSGLALTLAAHAQAGIVLNTTRVIYPATDKEISLQVHNTGAGEILAQSWLETDGENVSSDTPPFAITPALARMQSNARQLIRIIYSGEGLPADRESVLWLNVQEIPQTATENQLQIAIRQRIKLFFRPQGFTEDPLEAAQALQWQLRDGQLEVSNPGPYHVSMIKLDVRQQGRVLIQQDSRMLAPRQRLRLPLKQTIKAGPVELAFISINDFGAQESYRANVLGDRTAKARKLESRPD
jgi:P pilus assembly chaperone PapD